MTSDSEDGDAQSSGWRDQRSENFAGDDPPISTTHTRDHVEGFDHAEDRAK